MGVEGTIINLTCQFTESIPPVNNVTFFDNDQQIAITVS